MTIEDILQAESEDMERDLADHDAQAFTRRLAQRLADHEQADAAMSASRPAAARSERSPAPVRPAPSARSLRRRRTRPAPAVPGSGDLHRDLQRLCETVLYSEIERLVDFAEDYDDAGARTFACLLYSINRRDSALFWWRFAAGAGDQLAAHCLAVHHAADGSSIDARLWRTIARTMGYAPTQHLPAPLSEPSTPTPELARTLDPALQEFVEAFPKELALR